MRHAGSLPSKRRTPSPSLWSSLELSALTIVAREKSVEVKKGGLLEVCATAPSLDDIGGLDELKFWLVERRDAFGKEAQQYGLPAPKGLLIVGIPGTADSLAAKATASLINRPP